MSKKRKRTRRRSQPRHRPPQQQTEPSRWRRGIALLKTPLGLLCTVLGLSLTGVSTYYLFKAQVVVDPDAPLSAEQPLLTPFRITNKSVLAIYHITRAIGVNELATKG